VLGEIFAAQKAGSSPCDRSAGGASPSLSASRVFSIPPSGSPEREVG
jgi:hypothetical protein